jgi:hypothetical protein
MASSPRWQYSILFASAVGLLCGSIILIIALTGTGTPKASPWWVGAIAMGVSVVMAVFAWRSLAHARARDLLFAELDHGLFRLDESWPRPLILLNSALVRHFGLPSFPIEFDSIEGEPRKFRVAEKPEMPRTFAELVTDVVDRTANSATISPLQYEGAREALALVIARKPDSISWCCKLTDLLPRGRQRYHSWQRLRRSIPTLPPAVLSHNIEQILMWVIFASLIAVAVPIARSLDRNPKTQIHPGPFLDLVGHFLGIILFAVLTVLLMLPIYFVGRRFACSIPANFNNLDNLATAFPRDAEDHEAWTTERVEAHLRDLIQNAMGIKPNDVRPDTRLT